MWTLYNKVDFMFNYLGDFGSMKRILKTGSDSSVHGRWLGAARVDDRRGTE